MVMSPPGGWHCKWRELREEERSQARLRGRGRFYDLPLRSPTPHTGEASTGHTAPWGLMLCCDIHPRAFVLVRSHQGLWRGWEKVVVGAVKTESSLRVRKGFPQVKMPPISFQAEDDGKTILTSTASSYPERHLLGPS